MNYYVDTNNSINETLKLMKPNDILYIRKGIYKEKVKITTPSIKIIGEGEDTIITYKDYYNKINVDFRECLTVRSYTVLVQANDVTFENITIRNESVPSSIYGQAVALEVLGDNFKAISCFIKGAQDTLLSGPIPSDLIIRYQDLLPDDEKITTRSHQLYDNCYIEGDVDFIFGSGTAFFNKCHIHSIGRGYIAAPSHSKDEKYGFVFYKCKLTSDNIVDDIYLARPWRDYGRATFIDCIVLGNQIRPEGFHPWRNERINTCAFSIYKTIDTTKIVPFVKVLNDSDLNDFTMEKVLKS